MTLTTAGIDAYEEAMGNLLKEPAVKERWSDEELWGIVASMVVGASVGGDPAKGVEASLHRLRTIGEALVVLPVANVAWAGDPVTLEDLVVGNLNEAMLRAIERAANGRTTIAEPDAVRLIDKYRWTTSGREGGEALVAIAVWCPGQSMLAIAQAERRFRDLVDVALLLETRPATLGLFSLRGSTNRPGIRGATVHRSAIADGLELASASHELAAEIPVVSENIAQWHVRWHSTDPLPLDRLLSGLDRRAALVRCLKRGSPLARRIGVAARWHAEAHWATETDDAVLALGVALDALIGSREGLPGRAMRERFAFLEPNVSLRASRAKRHAEVYSARSAVAHAGSSDAAKDAVFVRGLAGDVVWATYRMLAFDELFSPVNDRDIDVGFESLRWGTASWDSTHRSSSDRRQ